MRMLGLRVPGAALLALVMVACGKPEPVDPEVTAAAIAPVAGWSLKAVEVEVGKRSGEEVAAAVCAACHDSGAVNAPKTGDTAAWAPRIALGFDALVASAIAGKGQMPPRGGGSDLTDDEVARAVAYLANQSGASFTAPPI